jgi:hypothetical protein
MDDEHDTQAGSLDGRIDLTASSTAQPDYGAWRDRMRKKSERNRDLAQPAPEPQRTAGAYWDPDLLFRGDDVALPDRVEQLSTLDLRDGATDDEIAAAFRSLAKVHHPDRWVTADAETRQHHEDCMRAVNEAYHALRSSQQA